MTDYPDLLSRHQYALVDCAGLFPESWHQALPLIPIVPKELKSDTDTMPALLPLDPGALWFQHLLDHLEVVESKRWKPILSCLLAVPEDVSLESLTWHLRDRLIVYSPQARALLRYYDSYIFPHFQRVLHPAQLQALYGSITGWTVYFLKTEETEWITEPPPGIMEHVPRFWSVSTEQDAALDRIGIVNQALDIWRAKTRPWESLAEYQEMAAHMDAAIVREQRNQPDAGEETLAFEAVEWLQKYQNRDPVFKHSLNLQESNHGLQ